MKLSSIKWVVVGVMMLAAVAVAADEKNEPPRTAAKHAGLERLKQLAGEWVGTEQGNPDEKVTVTYKVTAAGSAVVETLFPGTPHEMVTVYHRDGEALMLTHYCALGNQPRMRSEAGGGSNKFAFKFAGGTNLNPDKDMHMHEATISLPDDNTIHSEWTHYVGGKAAGTVKFELKRKK